MNHFLRAVMLTSLAGMPTVATAQPIYKCKANNSMIEYSQSACRGELIAVIYPDRGPTEADHQRALARIAAETERFRAQEEAAARLRALNRAADMQIFTSASSGTVLAPRQRARAGTNRGGVIPSTGQALVPSGSNAINPQTGDVWARSGSGFINPQTGQYAPGF